MPNSLKGFSTAEIVARVQAYIGNNSADFTTYLQETLPLAELRFCKMHDWTFLRKTNLSLSIINGTSEYELSVANIGHYMAAEDVETIFHPASGVVLKRLDLNQIRRLDPEDDDGSSSDDPLYWAPVGDSRIMLWPPSLAAGTLKIDGKITPPVITAVSSSIYPTIIPRYQESFIEYVMAMALDHENDDRASGKKNEAMALMRADIQDDMRGLSQVENARIRSMFEASIDGSGESLDAYYRWLFSSF